MSTTPLPRPAAVVNAEIRALWAAGVLSAEDRVRYRVLLTEWAAAVRCEQELAAVA
jgi:hypothetical protein